MLGYMSVVLVNHVPDFQGGEHHGHVLNRIEPQTGALPICSSIRSYMLN